MNEIKEIKAKDIMTGTIKSIDKNDTLNKAVSALLNDRIHNLIVLDNNKYAGIFGYKQLAKLHRRPEQTTKIANYIVKPPLIAEDTAILDIVEQMYRLNYKTIPIGNHSQVIGLITERDILNIILNSGILAGKKVKDFMTPAPFILHEEESLGKAYSLFRKHNVSRIPIIDKNKKLTGILESLDMIREISTKEHYGSDSGASASSSYIKPGAYVSDIIAEHKISVKSLMSETPVTAKPDDLLVDKIKENINMDTSTIAVIDEDNCPTGIIAPKDIIQYLAALKEEQTKDIQISGLESIKTINEYEKTEIYRITERMIKKISNLSEPRNFTIHAKAYHQEGNKTTYTFRCKFNTNTGSVFAKNHGWDPIETLSTLMDEAEKICIKKSKKRKDTIRSKIRDAKYSI